MAVHFAGNDLLVELAVVLDGIVVAVGQDTRSKLLFAVIAIEANLCTNKKRDIVIDGGLVIGCGWNDD